MAGPGSRRPKFYYLDRFKKEMEEMLMQLTEKKSTVLLQNLLIEEESRKALKRIEDTE